MTIKGSAHQEDTAVLNGYVPNNRTAKHAKTKQTKTKQNCKARQEKPKQNYRIELKGKIENPQLQVKTSTSLSSTTGRTIKNYPGYRRTQHRQSVGSDQHGTLCSKAEYTGFSSIQGSSTKQDHILGHKTNLKRFKRIDIIQRVSSDHKESNYKSITER